MDNNTQRVLLAKRILRELRTLSETVGTGFLRVQNQAKTISEDQKAQNERQKVPPMIRAILEVPDAEKAQNERTKTEKKWLERLKTFLEAATLGAVVVYAIINYHMLCEMRKDTETTGISAEAARNTAITADKTLKMDQRAWVGISFPKLPELKDGDLFLVPIEITNTGRTPAKKVEIDANCTILRGNIGTLDLNPAGPTHHSRLRFEIVQPNETVKNWGIPALDVDTKSARSVPVIVTPELRRRVADASYTVVAHGRMTYVDYSGKDHWLTFCHYVNGLVGGSEQCFVHNDFDKD